MSFNTDNNKLFIDYNDSSTDLSATYLALQACDPALQDLRLIQYNLIIYSVKKVPSISVTAGNNSQSEVGFNYTVPTNVTSFQFELVNGTKVSTTRTVSTSATKSGSYNFISDLNAFFTDTFQNVEVKIVKISALSVSGNGSSIPLTVDNLAYTVNNSFGIGSGTSSDPYIISCLRHFNNITRNSGKYFKQTAELDFGNVENANMLKTSTFSGVYDGNYQTIKNMFTKINPLFTDTSKSLNVGLFGTLSGTVKNLNIYDSKIVYDGSDHSGTAWLTAGMVCGRGEATAVISNVTLQNIEVQMHRSSSEMGGIAGGYLGTIKDCTIRGMGLYGNGDMGGAAGGLAASGTVTNCKIEALNGASRNVISHYSINKARSVGGLVGYSKGAVKTSTVTNTSFTLTGSDTLATQIGFGVGYQEGGSITSIAAGAERGNTETTTFTSNKAWKNYYFKYASKQIGRTEGATIS